MLVGEVVIGVSRFLTILNPISSIYFMMFNNFFSICV